MGLNPTTGSPMINHSAFIDLENALGNRLGNAWLKVFGPLKDRIRNAINDKNWAKANELVDQINLDDVVLNNAQYAQTIAISSLLLGASRIGPVEDSQVSKNPPEHQIQNGLKQWGKLITHNAPQLLKRSLHKQLARLEHQTEQDRHTITKAGPVDEERNELGEWTVGAGGDELFHGTTTEAEKRILKEGFKPSKNGLYGPGIYLTDSLNEAKRYGDSVVDVTLKPKLHLKYFTQKEWDAFSGNFKNDYRKAEAVLKKGGYVGHVIDRRSDNFGKYYFVIYDKSSLTKAHLVSKDDQQRLYLAIVPMPVTKEAALKEDFLDQIEIDGQDLMSLAANLMVSRLSSFGFLLEAMNNGIEKYQISAILDDHTCPVCEALDGTIFSVQDGVTQATAIMGADDSDSLSSIAPWPSQSKDSVQSLQDADAQDLVDEGLSLPPYHPNCRCIAVDVHDEQVGDSAQEAEQEADDVPALSLAALLAVLGLESGSHRGIPIVVTSTTTSEDDELGDDNPDYDEIDEAEDDADLGIDPDEEEDEDEVGNEEGKTQPPKKKKPKPYYW